MLALASAVGDAVDSGNIRLAVDSLRNEFAERRSIVQFRVSPDLYDWFYSARTGYRAQFWKSAAGGIVFNGKIVAAIAEILRRRLPAFLSVRAIKLLDPGTHEEIDAGELQVTRAQFLNSFQPDASKIWICERRYSNSRVQPDDIGTIELREAAKTGRLIVPRWEHENPETGQMAEGLLAPYPTPDNSWLDMKGGFVSADGSGSQVKPQDVRADQIRNYGWTWRQSKAEKTTMKAEKPTVGILAYGSLIENPDKEIIEVRTRTIDNVETPFNVEFARSSTKRGGAPTLVPVTGFGTPVTAKIIVVDTTVDDAVHRLYRREINRVGSARLYVHKQDPGSDDIVIERLPNFHGLGTVLYTRIGATIENPDAKNLAELAIASAKELDNGRDGISYLIDAQKHGIKTALSDEYAAEINNKMGTKDLAAALLKARSQGKSALISK
jgi:cation transport regulator ChaC